MYLDKKLTCKKYIKYLKIAKLYKTLEKTKIRSDFLKEIPRFF